jgi:hypothetical protein
MKLRYSASSSIRSRAACANFCARDLRANADAAVSQRPSCRSVMRANIAEIARLSGEVEIYGRVSKAFVDGQYVGRSGSSGRVGGGSIGKYT